MTSVQKPLHYALFSKLHHRSKDSLCLELATRFYSRLGTKVTNKLGATLHARIMMAAYPIMPRGHL